MSFQLTQVQLSDIARAIASSPGTQKAQLEFFTAAAPAQALQFDPRRRDFQMDPYPVFAHFRAMEPPVHCSKLYGGYFVFRYDDVARVCRNDAEFSAAKLGTADALRGLFRLDEPEHEQVRKLVESAWSTAVAAQAPAIQQSISKALGAIGDRLVFDLVDDFARPVPRDIYFDILGGAGISPPERDGIDQLARRMMKHHNHLLTTGQRLPEFEAARDLGGKFQAMLQSVPGNPAFKNSFLEQFLPVIGTGPLTPEVAMTTLINVTVAGYMSVEFLLATGIRRLLLGDAADWDVIREDPAQLTDYLEEMRRFEHALAVVDRFAKIDGITIGGVPIPKGAPVFGVLASANRDESVFGATADRFEPKRSDKRTRLGLGYGPHECMGRALEGLITEPAIRELAKAMPKLRLQSAAQPPWFDNFYFRSFDHLPVKRI